jgi:hypothetical protein
MKSDELALERHKAFCLRCDSPHYPSLFPQIMMTRGINAALISHSLVFILLPISS